MKDDRNRIENYDCMICVINFKIKVKVCSHCYFLLNYLFQGEPEKWYINEVQYKQQQYFKNKYRPNKF